MSATMAIAGATVGAGLGGVGAMLASWYSARVALEARKPSNSVAPLPAWVVRLVGYLLPARHRVRYLEEWRAELADLRGRRRLLHALDLVRGGCRLAWQLRLQGTPRRGPHQHVVPMGDLAQDNGWLSAAFLVESMKDGRIRYRLMCARRQDDDVRIVVLSRYSRRDSPREITALVREAAALGAFTKRAVRRKARLSKKVEW